ncbi:MAG: hypothetical protein K6G90_05820, partial [Clostridia bacterium]|nr:hypothetical protein [Clostridia bacterium]
CTKCDATKTAAIAAPGHKWNKGEVTKPATTTETGERTYTCERCGETKVETIAKAGSCRVCGAAHNKNLIDRLLGFIHAIWYYFLILDRTF